MNFGMDHGMVWFSTWHLFALPLLLAIGFLPTFIALARHHHNSLAIFALNLLLGWTGIGWIAALIWSLTATPAEPKQEA
jgi:ABC-type transport system involved in cytochrome c biogenesis permease component